MDEPNLADFVKAQEVPRLMWCDRLPEEIQDQLLNTDCAARVASEWLISLGYTDCTDTKVDTWRRKRRPRSEWSAETR